LCLLHHKSKLGRDSIFQIQVSGVVVVLHQTVPRAKQFGCKLPYTHKQATMKFPQDFKIFSWCIRQDWLHLNYVKRHRSTSTTLCATTTSFCGCTGSTSTTPCAGSTLHAATTRHPAAQGLPQPCRTPRLLVARLYRLYRAYAAHLDAPSRRSTSRWSVALALAVGVLDRQPTKGSTRSR
jgi:hypothetical protein